MYIYLDESGDLGFDFSKPKTTKKFVVTLLVCDNHLANAQFEKAVKRTLKNKLNRRKTKTRIIHELKGTSTTFDIKQYFFRQLKNDQWGIYSLTLNKQRVWEPLRTKKAKPRLYNYIARHLLEKLPLRTAFSNVRVIVDKSKNRQEIQDFNQYVKNQLEALLPLNTALQIEHLTSQQCPGLQAVDLFCWGIFRKYESNDFRWYQIFADRIIYQTEYLPPKDQ